MIAKCRLEGVCLAAAVFSSGCIHPYMAQASPPQRIEAAPEQATVVFVRPQQFPVREGQIITVVDDAGRFLGQLNDADHFAVRVPPGPHRFVGFFREHADMIRADLAPGRVYYVHVAVAPSGWYAQVNMEALSPRRPSWADRQGWLERTRQLVPLSLDGQAALDPMEARRKIRNAERRWELLSETERQARSLAPPDGDAGPSTTMPHVPPGYATGSSTPARLAAPRERATTPARVLTAPRERATITRAP